MQTLIKKYALLAYAVIAFALTWVGSLIYYFATPKGGQVLPALLTFPASLIWYFGPCLAAIAVSGISEGKERIRRLLRRFLIWKVGWRWYAFIVLYPLALHLAVIGLDRLLGGPAPVFFQAEGVPAGNVWLTLLGLILLTFFMRGIGEETGWRGFALPYLQARYSAAASSLILGILWALWHFHPANFSALLSRNGAFIFLNIVATTFIYTWVFNHTQGSLLIAGLFHMTLDVAEYVAPIGYTGTTISRNLLQIGIVTAAALLLLLASGRQLGKERGS